MPTTTVTRWQFTCRSDEAQAEARELMSATNNLLKPADGAPVLNIGQDVVLG
jgi:DNA-directed RNA polymerase beta' subunit